MKSHAKAARGAVLAGLAAVLAGCGGGAGGPASLPAAAPASVAVAAAAAPAAIEAPAAVLEPAEEAALAAPEAAIDVAGTDPSGSAEAQSVVLDGEYHGPITEVYVGGGHRSGTVTLSVKRVGHTLSGRAELRSTDGSHLSLTLSGTANAAAHGDVLSLTVTSSNGCAATGPARREGHSLFGKLAQPDCPKSPAGNYIFKAYKT